MIEIRSHYVAALLALSLCGCAGPDYGPRFLDVLRAEEMIRDEGGEWMPTPAAPGAEHLAEVPIAGDGRLSLESLFALADERHPRLAAARAAIGEAGARAWQSTLAPNPSIEVESENMRTTGGGFGQSETTVRLVQPITVGHRREAAASVGEAQMDQQRLALQAARREVHARIRRIVTAIAGTREAIAEHERLIELATQAQGIAAARFDARAAPEAEAIRARVEVANLLFALSRLRGEQAAQAEELFSALGGVRIYLDRLDADLTLGLDGRMPALEQLEKAVRESHPAVLAAQAHARAARRQIDLDRALARPDLSATVGAGVAHADDEGFFEVGLSVPLTIFDRNQGGVLAARFEAIRLAHEAEALVQETNGLLAQAYRRWESAIARLRVFESQILGDARQLHQQTVLAYEAGRRTLLDLLDAQRTLIDASLVLVDLRREAGAALSEVYEIVGESLELSTEGGGTP